VGPRGVTCEGVSSKLNKPLVTHTLALAIVADFKAALNAAGWPGAAGTVVAVRQPCMDFNVSCLGTDMGWQAGIMCACMLCIQAS
jgi:hypothetical protein